MPLVILKSCESVKPGIVTGQYVFLYERLVNLIFGSRQPGERM